MMSYDKDMKKTKDDPHSQLAVSLLCFSLFLPTVPLPCSSEHSYITVCGLTLCHFQHPRKHNVSLLSLSCIRALFGPVRVCARVRLYVHALEELLQYHLMAVTHYDRKVHSQTHKRRVWYSGGKHIVHSVEMTAIDSQRNYLAEQEEKGKREGGEWWMWKRQ